MNLALHDKIALVTGGGRGLGRSIVRGLTQAGAHVVVTAARQSEEIERVASEAPKDAVAAFLADVTKEEDCARVVQETLKRFGKLDVLINNAGRGMKYVNESFLTQPTRFWETDPDT
jgi:NAD(P)-dependent dehydrogenase (short-subunit alcohol dehydrogenase family)